MPPASRSAACRPTRRLIAWLISVALVAALAPAAAEVDATPDWQWVTDVAPVAAASLDEVIYLGGGFRYIGSAIDDGESFVSADAGELAQGCATRTGSQTGLRPTVVVDPAGGLFMQVPAVPDEMFDGAGIFDVSPAESFVRIGADCRFDRAFRLSPFVAGDLATRGLTITRIGEAVYVAGARPNGFADQLGRVVAFSGSTGQRIRELDLIQFDTVLIEGAEPGGRLVVSAAARHNGSGPAAVGLLHPTTGQFTQLAVTAGIASGFVKVVGSTLYLHAGAANAPLQAFDLATGLSKAGWSNPVLTVTDLEVGEGRVFVAGSGLGRTGVFALTESTGALVDAFTPMLGAEAGATLSVERLALAGTRLFVRGRTVRVLGTSERYLLAAVNATTGAADAWAPMAFPPTSTGIDLLPNGDWMYVGRVASDELLRRSRLAGVDSLTGEVLEFNPAVSASPALAPVTALAAHPDFLFAATSDGLIRRVSLASGQVTSWGVRTTATGHPGGYVAALAATGTTLYAGGFFDAAVTSSQPQQVARAHGLAVEVNSAELTDWNPAIVSAATSPASEARPVTALTILDNAIQIGGNFTTVGGAERIGVAAVDPGTGAPLPPGTTLPAGTTILDLASSPDGTYFVGRTGTAPVIGVTDVLAGTATVWELPEGVEPSSRIAYSDGLVYSGPEWDPQTADPTTSSLRWVRPESTDFGLVELADADDGDTGPNRIRFHASGAGVNPGAPRDLTVRYAGLNVFLSWTEPLVGDVESFVIRAGPASGQSTLADFDTGSTSTTFLATAAEGVYYVRVHARTAEGLSPASNEVAFALAPHGCNGPPAAPPGLSGTGARTGALLEWGIAVGSSSYIVEAGSAPSASDLARLPVGARLRYQTAAPAGTYFVRVRGINACGPGPASNEIVLTVGGPPPAAPTALRAIVDGSTVTLSWNPPTIGSAPAYYRLEAGSGPGLANLATTLTQAMSLVVPAVPPGTYYVRARAGNANGLGAATADLLVVVP